MAYKETFSCDSCGTVKKETNNWFMIRDDDKCNSYRRETFKPDKAFDFRKNSNLKHACSFECSTKIENRLKEKMQSLPLTSVA